jgi:hypothetical protein
MAEKIRLKRLQNRIVLIPPKSTALSEIIINNTTINSKHSINVLGVEFDSRLQWNTPVSKTITKAKKATHAIRLVCKYL